MCPHALWAPRSAGLSVHARGTLEVSWDGTWDALVLVVLLFVLSALFMFHSYRNAVRFDEGLQAEPTLTSPIAQRRAVVNARAPIRSLGR